MELNVFVACDSYKGSLTSIEANTCIEKGIKTVFKHANVECMPIADGGEGTVEACIYNNGYKKSISIEGEDIEVGFNDETSTCIIEMASVNGILNDVDKSIYERNTYKTGLLIKYALDSNYKNIIVGIGGSGTNDCGMGLASALGYRFLDEHGKEVEPYISNAFKVQSIDSLYVHPKLKETRIMILSDVKNPLLGKESCAHIYGKQKGASDEDIENLENLDYRFFEVCKKCGYVKSDFEGAGAAGGLGFGLVVFLKAKIISGIEYMLSHIEKEEEMDSFDLIVTGEGKIDVQSQYGKVIYGMKKLGNKYDIPVISIGGSVVLEDTKNLLYTSCVQKCCNLQDAMENAQSNLVKATIQCMNLIYCGMKMGGVK